ncbi:MAG: hypothetical protein ACKVP4_07310 [Hyphomicrobium sp.]
MAKNSMSLFFQGRLFQDPAKVMMQLAIGIALTVLLLVVLAGAGVSMLGAAAAAGFIGGLVQPYLFRNLKYR